MWYFCVFCNVNYADLQRELVYLTICSLVAYKAFILDIPVVSFMTAIIIPCSRHFVFNEVKTIEVG